MKMRKKKVKKSEKEIKEVVEVKETEVGEVLPITADRDNPVSDGKEFAGGDKNE